MSFDGFSKFSSDGRSGGRTNGRGVRGRGVGAGANQRTGGGGGNGRGGRFANQRTGGGGNYRGNGRNNCGDQNDFHNSGNNRIRNRGFSNNSNQGIVPLYYRAIRDERYRVPSEDVAHALILSMNDCFLDDKFKFLNETASIIFSILISFY